MKLNVQDTKWHNTKVKQCLFANPCFDIFNAEICQPKNDTVCHTTYVTKFEKICDTIYEKDCKTRYQVKTNQLISMEKEHNGLGGQ